MAKNETGWTKDVPTVNGWYWVKDDKTGPVLTEALNGCFYIHNSRYIPEPLDEWLGPISPSDFEQLTRLREAAEAARAWICHVSNQYVLSTDEPHEVLKKLRQALDLELAQRHTGGEKS